MKQLLQLGWALRRGVIGALRLHTRGVKVMLFNHRGELLLIRNAYGDTRSFVLPGGGVSRREDPLAAAARELMEEVGIAATDLRLLGEYQASGDGKRDSVSLCEGRSDQPIRIDGQEVSAASFYSLDAPPEATSPATRRRVQQWREGGPFGGAW